MVQSMPNKMGRGFALRTLWKSTDFDTYCFTDVDLSSKPNYILRLVSQIDRGSDVAVGSRYCAGSKVNRPPLRDLTSRTYNWFLRQTFQDGVRDHQCGLKAFSKNALAKILPLSSEDSWFWDTEMIVLAKNLGLRVTEVPVEWDEKKYAYTPIPRLMHDVYLHGTGILRLKRKVDATNSLSLRKKQVGSPSGEGT